MAEKPPPELPPPVAVTRHLVIQTPANPPVSGFPLLLYFSRHLPREAATRHPKRFGYPCPYPYP